MRKEAPTQTLERCDQKQKKVGCWFSKVHSGRGEYSEGKEWLGVPGGEKGHHIELLSLLSVEVGS